MNRETIYNSPGVRRLINDKQLLSWSNFYITHKDVFLPTDQKMALLKRPSMVSSPISNIAQYAIDAGLARLVSLAVLSPHEANVPEVVTYQYVTFDTRQMDSQDPAMGRVLNAVPELSDKLVFNISQNYRTTTNVLANIPQFHAIFVRDLLSRSYFDATRTTWLSANLTQFLCKVYSMSVGDTVAYHANLDMKTRGVVVAILAYFYQTKMSDAESARALLKTNYRSMMLPDPVDLDQIFAMVADILQKPQIDTLDDAFFVINNLGIDRLKVDSRLLVSRLKSYGPDPFSVRIAMDYPPYFAYLILYALSSKTGLSFKLKSSSQLQREAAEFAHELLRSALFIPALS